MTTTTGAELTVLIEEGNAATKMRLVRRPPGPETLVRQEWINPEPTQKHSRKTDDHGGGKKCEVIWTSTGGAARRAGGTAQECQLGPGRSDIHGRVGVGECLAVPSGQRRSRFRMTVGEL